MQFILLTLIQCGLKATKTLSKTEWRMKERIFLMKRSLQWSYLTSGLPIPGEFHQLAYDLIGQQLSAKQSAEVRIQLDGEIFSTRLYNIGFDRNKYVHLDVLQFKYDSNKSLLAKLQNVFSREYKYCMDARELRNPNDKKRIKISKYFDTSIIVYGTDEPGLFILEPQFENIAIASQDEIRKMSEEEFETIITKKDHTAKIKEKTRLQKVRELDVSIGNSLKMIYDYRCQMTGEKIGEQYGVNAVEAHHIIPFTKSLNNDTSNIIILSPSYHRIIHKAKPVFNRKTLSFEYPNSLVEKVKLNYHL